MQVLARQALAKLEKLRALVESANNEILELEQWLSQALLEPRSDLPQSLTPPSNAPAEKQPSTRH